MKYNSIGKIVAAHGISGELIVKHALGAKTFHKKEIYQALISLLKKRLSPKKLTDGLFQILQNENNKNHEENEYKTKKEAEIKDNEEKEKDNDLMMPDVEQTRINIIF